MLAQQPQGQLETAQEQKENTQITSGKRKHKRGNKLHLKKIAV